MELGLTAAAADLVSKPICIPHLASAISHPPTRRLGLAWPATELAAKDNELLAALCCLSTDKHGYAGQ